MPARLPLVALALLLAGCGSGNGARAARDAGAGAGPDSRTEPVEASLRRFPGVDVRETPDGVQVRIRGDSSFMGGQEPLYVVDGTPVTPGASGTLVGVHPADIVSIEVLKSAAETSVYGPRGANGVVVVRTRTGSR